MLVLFVTLRTNEVYGLSLIEVKIDIPSHKRVLVLELPGGIQMSITAFSSMFVMGYINRFGSACMAG